MSNSSLLGGLLMSLHKFLSFSKVMWCSWLFPPMQIATGFLKQLAEKVKGDVECLDKGEETAMVAQHFENTVQHIRHSRESGEATIYNDIHI